VKRTEVAAGSDDAVVEINGFLFLLEHWLDACSLFSAVELLDLTPNEFAAHTLLDDRRKSEGQSIQVLRLDIGAQHTRSVLEVLLGIHNGH